MLREREKLAEARGLLERLTNRADSSAFEQAFNSACAFLATPPAAPPPDPQPKALPLGHPYIECMAPGHENEGRHCARGCRQPAAAHEAKP